MSKRSHAQRKAEKEWRRVREQLQSDHPYWFRYLDK